MFDDETDDVGQEVEAFCPRCKADTTHVVVSRYDDEIRRARCSTCDDVHAFRRPRGEDSEEGAEPTTKRKAPKAKPSWEQAMARRRTTPKTYHGDELFGEMDIVEHPLFGMGFVSELIGQNKIEVTFQTDKRILIHNRRGLPLFQILRQRHEAEARARSDSRARGAAGRAQKARVVKPPVVEEVPDLEDLDLPDVLDEEIPVDMPESRGRGMGMGKGTKLSAKALKALEDEDEDESGSSSSDDEDDEGGSKRKARKAGPATKAAKKAADSDDLDDEDAAEGKPKRKGAASQPPAMTPERGRVIGKPAVAALPGEPKPGKTGKGATVSVEKTASKAPAKGAGAPDKNTAKPAASPSKASKPPAKAEKPAAPVKAAPGAAAKGVKLAAKGSSKPAKPPAKVLVSPPKGSKPVAKAKPPAKAAQSGAAKAAPKKAKRSA